MHSFCGMREHSVDVVIIIKHFFLLKEEHIYIYHFGYLYISPSLAHIRTYFSFLR